MARIEKDRVKMHTKFTGLQNALHQLLLVCSRAKEFGNMSMGNPKYFARHAGTSGKVEFVRSPPAPSAEFAVLPAASSVLLLPPAAKCHLPSSSELPRDLVGDQQPLAAHS